MNDFLIERTTGNDYETLNINDSTIKKVKNKDHYTHPINLSNYITNNIVGLHNFVLKKVGLVIINEGCVCGSAEGTICGKDSRFHPIKIVWEIAEQGSYWEPYGEEDKKKLNRYTTYTF